MRDAAGNSTTSAAVSVIVQNTTSGLVAAYGFSEASGSTVTDASGNGNTGTISGATRTSSGRFGSALTFDGVNNWVTVADAPTLDLTRMTLEAWVYPTALSNWRTVLIKEQPGDLVYALYANTGFPGTANRPSGHVFSGTDFDTRGTAQLALNTWTHLAATWDGVTLRLYVNGIQVSTRAVGGSMPNSSGPLHFGGNAIWGEWYKGLIDEVRIYTRPLTQGEIQTDMNTPLP